MKHHRLAILDTRSGAIRALGRGDGSEGSGIWSRDGSRVAFERRFLDGRDREFCTVDFDGSAERCGAPVGLHDMVLLGWADDRRIVASAASDSLRNAVWIVQPDSGWRAMLLVRQALGAALSPNGLLLAWREPVGSRDEVLVAPLGDIGRARRVQTAAERGAELSATWSVYGIPAPFVDSLRLLANGDTIMAGVPDRPRLLAFWSDGRVSVATRARWSVTAGNGTIDTAGTIIAREPGTLEMRATIGGWRSTARRFTVVRPHSAVIMTERWHEPLARWRLFGVPTPRLVHDRRLGDALSNEGDGSYFSGAYLTSPLRGAGGLAVDAILRTPVTELQWQSLALFVMALGDSAELQRWDHRSGYLPNVSGQNGIASCGLQYPAGDGLEARQHVAAHIDPAMMARFDASGLRNGTPWRLRLQVFPDGRCGIAVNRRPIAISALRFPPQQPLLLVTTGNAWRTQMLLGPLSIYSGVPSDVAWTAAAPPRARVSTTRPKGPPASAPPTHNAPLTEVNGALRTSGTKRGF
jgi:hypothetical protein